MNALEILWQSPLIYRLGCGLLHFLWQGLLIAMVLAMAMRILRNHSAGVRYLAAWTSLAAMALLVPITAWLAAPPSAAETACTAVEPPGVEWPADSARARAVEPWQIDDTLQPDSAESSLATLPEVASPKQAATSRLLTAGVSQRIRSALPWIVCCWLLGALALSVWRLSGWIYLRRLCRLGVRPASETARQILTRLLERLPVGPAVRLLESTRIDVPMVVGWLRPIILLPASILTELSVYQLESILAHELAHIRRHDFLLNLVQTAVETLLFYHPAVWWISRRIRLEREACCDDWAVAGCGDRLLYARALTRLEELRHKPAGAFPANVGVAADGAPLLSRIRRVLGLPGEDRQRRRSWLAGSVFVLLLITGLAVSVVMLGADASAIAQQSQAVEPGSKTPPVDAGETTEVEPAVEKKDPDLPPQRAVNRMARSLLQLRETHPEFVRYQEEADHSVTDVRGQVQVKLSYEHNFAAGSKIKAAGPKTAGKPWCCIAVRIGPDSGEPAQLEMTQLRLAPAEQAIRWDGQVDARGYRVADPPMTITASVQTGSPELRKAVNRIINTELTAMLRELGRNGESQDTKNQPTSGKPVEIEIVANSPKPKMATLLINYKMPGDEPTGVFWLQRRTREGDGWRIHQQHEPIVVKNGAVETIKDLRPGIYDLARLKKVKPLDRRMNLSSKTFPCDRRDVELKPGEETKADFVRGEDAKPITGRVTGLPDGSPFMLTVAVRSASATGDLHSLEKTRLPTYDVLSCRPGKPFTSAPIPPGEYTLVAEALRPLTQDALTTGKFLPDFLGTAKVTVPAEGKVPEVEIKTLPRDEFERRLKKAEAAWGKPVDGLQCRLRPAKSTWDAGDWPALQADLRNRGYREFTMGLAPEYWEIQCDGVWYRSRVTLTSLVKLFRFKPGDQKNGISFMLEIMGWRSREGNEPLVFKPGKHTLRAAFQLNSGSVRIVSNPVEIEIVSAGSPKTSVPTEPAQSEADAEAELKALAAEIREIELRCVPAKGTLRHAVESRFGEGAPGDSAKAPRKRGSPASRYWLYEFCENGSLLICYDSESLGKVVWAHYLNPYATKNRAKPPTAEERLRELKPRLRQMQHILATYEKRFGEDYKNAWGKAVEGAQVRLRTDKKAWGINEDPSFQVDLRNKGKQELFIAYPQWFEVEVDGKRHASKSWHSGMPRSIGFGDRLTYSLSLSDFLPSPAAGDDQPLLRPGKHAIRVALAKVGYRDGKGVMQLSGRKLGAVSNPVEIEMTRPEPAGAEIRKETPP